MTMPNGPSGVDNNYYGVTNDGTVPGMKTRTQSNTEASLKTKVGQSPGWGGASNTFFGSILGGFINGITGFISSLFGGLSGTSGGSFLDLLGNLLGTQNGLAQTINQIVGGWAGTVPPNAGQIAQTMNEIRTATVGGHQVIRLYGSGTWTVPDGFKTFHIAGWTGGNGGQAGNSSGNPGLSQSLDFSCGFRSRTFTVSELGGAGNQIPYATGNGGAGGGGGGAYQVGGTGGNTTFGNPSDGYYMVASVGRSEMSSALGWGPSTSRAGYGGQGGNSSSYTGFGGQNASVALGGAGGGRGANGANGQDAPLSDIPSGGAGGGGGGGNSGFFSAAGNGGNGGAPGGCGGSGGASGSSSPYGLGGNGAPGRIQITCE